MTPAPVPTTVKCLVWDLDDTLWDGAVLEGDRPVPFQEAGSALRTLDERGILHAVASRGDRARAMAHLTEQGLADLFTVEEIGWGPKSEAVRRIADALGIGIDTVAFIDNDPLERAEVSAALPAVRTYPAEAAGTLAGLPEFRTGQVTGESRQRRLLYRREAERRRAKESYAGPPAEFLATLGLEMTVRRADEADLVRAEELTVRTHQLNTTGRTYDMAELRALCDSPSHEVLVADLKDRFGAYGTVGLALTEQRGDTSCLQLLLLSCRVMSRGVGPALIGHLVRDALAAGRRPTAEFVPTEVNRVMLVNLRFSGFEVLSRTGDTLLLGHTGASPQPETAGPVRVVTTGTQARR
ncbi:HAD-IIIC family phosphatase [Streptomyces sp. NPDC021093]|uniref:HAD-IIIC family phosphatase n=1 Tax=Streptomyces sp. NPDC021093 TaxID=3365112 RepID=UPI0037B1341D